VGWTLGKHRKTKWWLCSLCHKHRKVRNSWCAECANAMKREYNKHRTEKNRAYNSRWRKSNVEKRRFVARIWYRKNKRRILVQRRRDAYKIHARTILNNAVRTGIIVRLPCEVCGDLKTHGHHDNYSFPLKVRWLCATHHSKIHARKGCENGLD
jgi:hypothetical protein